MVYPNGCQPSDLGLVSMYPSSVIRAAAAALCLVSGGPALWASEGPPVTRSITNATAIQIPDDGPASIYPSTITVSGRTGVVTRVTVTLRGMNHAFPDDIDILLAGPGGKRVMLMSDAGGSFPLDDANVTFADGSPIIPNSGQIVTGSYGPTNWGLTADAFPAPAPSAPYLIGLTNFNGLDPNEAWELFVFDDALDSTGSIDNGWVLTVTSVEIFPDLAIARQGQSVEVSWPAPSTGYVLEEREALTTGPPWSMVTNAVSFTNGQNHVSVAVNPTSRFFRLRK